MVISSPVYLPAGDLRFIIYLKFRHHSCQVAQTELREACVGFHCDSSRSHIACYMSPRLQETKSDIITLCYFYCRGNYRNHTTCILVSSLLFDQCILKILSQVRVHAVHSECVSYSAAKTQYFLIYDLKKSVLFISKWIEKTIKEGLSYLM